MSVSVDDTGAQLPDNAAETRATEAVREMMRGASCKEVLATLWPSDTVDEPSLGAFARALRNDLIHPPKTSYLRQILAKAVSTATDAGFSDDALCEQLAQAVVCDDDVDAALALGLDLVAAMRRQQKFMRAMVAERGRYEREEVLSDAIAEYHVFLKRVKHSEVPLEPTPIVDLVWHTHQQFPARYAVECRRLAGSFVDHDDDE